MVPLRQNSPQKTLVTMKAPIAIRSGPPPLLATQRPHPAHAETASGALRVQGLRVHDSSVWGLGSTGFVVHRGFGVAWEIG